MRTTSKSLLNAWHERPPTSARAGDGRSLFARRAAGQTATGELSRCKQAPVWHRHPLDLLVT
jgi:hypothetical protein